MSVAAVAAGRDTAVVAGRDTTVVALKRLRRLAQSYTRRVRVRTASPRAARARRWAGSGSSLGDFEEACFWRLSLVGVLWRRCTGLWMSAWAVSGAGAGCEQHVNVDLPKS